MAKIYPHFQMQKIVGDSEYISFARSVMEMLDEGEKKFGKSFRDSLKTASILVNGRNINYLGGYQTKLGDEDEVWFVYPSAGG
jgi:molybdopterin converting factor small subunit